MKRGPLLTALREATATEHRAVEALMPPAWDTIDRQTYARHLATLAGFHVPLEDRLYATHDWAALGLPEAGARRRAELLDNDLRALGVDPDGVRRCRDLPDVALEARALGTLYVLEGSALGGQILARQVRQALGDGAPSAFFDAGGADVSARWRSFCGFAESRAARGSDAIAPAVDAAVETFRALRRWLG